MTTRIHNQKTNMRNLPLNPQLRQKLQRQKTQRFIRPLSRRNKDLRPWGI
jgi:hypothetical protein